MLSNSSCFSIQSSPTVTTSRERPRTSSQTSLPSAVPPPVSHPEPPPQVAKPATSFDLLSDLGADPFAQQPQQTQG